MRWHRTWRVAWQACDRAGVGMIVVLVGAYKRLVSPLIGNHCRYQPTCSTYFLEAVEKYGAVRGSLRGIARICRCHPWRPGGYDPP